MKAEDILTETAFGFILRALTSGALDPVDDEYRPGPELVGHAPPNARAVGRGAARAV